MYKINGIELNLQPTTGKWVTRSRLGMTGAGHPVYPATRSFEMTWQLVSRSDANELQAMYEQLSTTGTVVVELPKYRSATWEYEAYTGCTLGEPESSEYFNEYETDITMLVYGVVTE